MFLATDPTMSDIITAVGTFITDYSVYIAAALVVGVGAFLLGRLIRSGR